MLKILIFLIFFLSFVYSDRYEWKNKKKLKSYKRKYYKDLRSTENSVTSLQNQNFEVETVYGGQDGQAKLENIVEPNYGPSQVEMAVGNGQFPNKHTQTANFLSKISFENSLFENYNKKKGLKSKNGPKGKIMASNEQIDVVSNSDIKFGGQNEAQKMDVETCICVLPSLCDQNFYIKENGEGIINERLGSVDPPTVKCANVLEICCKIKNAQQVASTILNTPIGANTTPLGGVTGVTTPVGSVTTAGATPSGGTPGATTPAGTPGVTTAGTPRVTTVPGVTTVPSVTVPVVTTVQSITPSPGITTPLGAVTTPTGAPTTTTQATTRPPTQAPQTAAPTTAVPVATTPPVVQTTPSPAPTTLTPVATTPTQPPTTPTQPPTTPTRPATPVPTTPPVTMTTPTTTTTRTPTTLPPAGQCGISYATNKELAAGESPFIAAFMEFPWMLALLDYQAISPDGRTMNNAFVCGASLLSKDIAMTAAHCIKGRGPSALFVRAGDWNTLYANESLPHQDRSLSKIILHPEYNNLTLFNDIAILKLDQPVLFGNNVQPICLPRAEDKFFGQNCIATGWGQNAFGPTGRYATKMRKVTLPILNQNDCQDRFRRTRLGPFFNFHESFICAGGGENYDTCTGDGGGPLFCKTGNTYTQAGIVSWGIGCGQKDVPGAYVNVPYLKPWIDSTMYTLMRDNLPK